MVGRYLRIGLMVGAGCAAFGLLVPPATAQTGAEAGSSFELAFWQAVAASNDPVLYEAYLKQFPGGTFAAIARAKTGNLHKPTAPTALPTPQFGPGFAASAPAAASAVRDAAAAQQTAQAAQAAAAAMMPPMLAADAAALPADRPLVTALAAPSAPIAPPAFAAAPIAGTLASDAAQDLFGNAAAMPVGSQALLASLAPTATPPAIAPPPAPPVAPTASFGMLAALGAAPPALPTAEALEAAVAAQATPARLARAEVPTALPSSAAVSVTPTEARPQYAAAAYTPRPRGRRGAMPAQFTRAVVSSAAVSVEMPDASAQISPLGIMLGQLVRTQETPGTQFGLAEEVAMPLRPRLIAVPEVMLPQSFCSIEQRSAFSEGVYQPALAIAAHNDQVASAHIRRLRAVYDNYQLSGDSTSLASIAAEARDFWRQATAASSIHDELVNQFEDIMAIPVRACGAVQ